MANLWFLWFLSVHAVTALLLTKPTSDGQPLATPSLTHGDLPTNIAHTLTRCPEKFHDCSSAFHNRIKEANVIMCSCAPNCRVNGDCCWSVPFSTQVAQTSKASCIEVRISNTTKLRVSMVNSCLPTWPTDSVRFGCERPELFEDKFYDIPATTVTGVTYRNGFCALCNDDLASAIFWSVGHLAEDASIDIVPPRFVRNHQSLYLRPCDPNVTVDACSVDASEVVSQKCKTYYAPVRDASSTYSPVFKNVYCALCNTVNVSRLSCSSTVSASKTAYKIVIPSHPRGLLKPVLQTLTCYAHYDGRCYIGRSRSAPNTHRNFTDPLDTPVFEEPTKLQHAPYTYILGPEIGARLLKFIAIACIALSICVLVLKLVVYCAFKEARNSSSTCTTCLAGTLLVTQVLFVVPKCVDLEECACFMVAVFSHYCFLSTFLWTCVLSFDIWKRLTTVQMSPTSRNTLAWYSLFAWGAPLLVVSGAVAEDYTAPESVLSPRYADLACFICSFWGLLVYFFLPLVLLVFFCLILYFHTVCYIRTTAAGMERGNDVAEPGCRNGSTRQQRTNLALFMRLSLVMGAPWAVTLVGAFVPDDTVESAVDVMIGVQGVYLFFAFKDYRYISVFLRKKFTTTATSMASLP
ncbi:hypothetical protein HPB51_011876 [Rhipicephalus microplus]|uniref:G-protein coupled receptors family 2 profile 2 domain-containing protein n=1 Tax=Rhipicephalus microplus TaxID=6941 RepID=A0A9J6E9P7_RHIMP|nr:hypothetical protein HPB51_011876 [Rhipicephalus microplus]